MDRRAFLRLAGTTAGALAFASPSILGRQAAQAADLGKIAYQLSWIKNFQFAGEYVADYKKYYEQAGVEVDLIAGGPTMTVDPVVASGKALIGQSSPDNTANAINKGAPLKIIGANYQKSPFCMISLTKTALKTPADMIGKKIGIQSANLLLWHAFLKINKIDPAKINTVPVQFDFSPLVSGEVDGFFGYSNDDVIHLRSKGNDVSYFLFADYGYKLFTATYTVTTAALKDKTRRAQLVAFMRGDIMGWQDVVKDPSLGAKLTVTVYGKDLGLEEEEQKQSAALTNELMVNDATDKHGLFWMTDQAIAETIESLAAADVKATPDMFSNEILAEVYQGKSSL
jgi:ABC-type nitrate/sulfonate/bicarbonate transport system substrate-binding protein